MYLVPGRVYYGCAMWLRSHISFSRSYTSNYSSYIEIITSQNRTLFPFILNKQIKNERGKKEKGKKKKKKMEGKKKDLSRV